MLVVLLSCAFMVLLCATLITFNKRAGYNFVINLSCSEWPQCQWLLLPWLVLGGLPSLHSGQWGGQASLADAPSDIPWNPCAPVAGSTAFLAKRIDADFGSRNAENAGAAASEQHHIVHKACQLHNGMAKVLHFQEPL